MASVTINGTTFNVQGNNISMIGNKLYVDGIEVDVNDGKPLSGEVTLKIEGDVANLSVDRGNITINGNTQDVKASNITVNGNTRSLNATNNIVIKGNVTGNVDGGNNVTCGDVIGNIDAANNVTCGNVKGDIDAGNNVKYIK